MQSGVGSRNRKFRNHSKGRQNLWKGKRQSAFQVQNDLSEVILYPEKKYLRKRGEKTFGGDFLNDTMFHSQLLR